MQVSKLTQACTLSLLVALAAGATAQPWEGPYTTLSSDDVSNVIYENENHTPDPIVVGVAVSAQTRTWVYGSDQSPPWTSKFDPKVNQFFTAYYAVRSITIPGGYEHVVTHSYSRETGDQWFSRAFPEYVEIATRYRLWDTPAPGAIVAITRLIQP